MDLHLKTVLSVFGRVRVPQSPCFSAGERNTKHMAKLYQKTRDGSRSDQQRLGGSLLGDDLSQTRKEFSEFILSI